MKGPGNERFITSVDVARYLDDLARRRGGYWSFSLACDRDRERGFRMSVVLERRDDVVYAKCTRHARREWAYYPSNVHSSLAGCMFDLCHRLDNKLDEQERLAQDGMPF